ncbi:hypothetical protein [Sphingomonas sp. DT-204]|uniref:hypothetical protein n=1 Tax=Sphingomonas sp. DT-204 TaxID=3396166 RepID=UPI003F1B7C12
MKLDLAALLREAWALWRRDHALLIPVAGLTMFLPRLALQLLIPEWPAPEQGATGEQAMLQWSQAFAGWVGRYGGWFVLAVVIGLWGALTIVALYLDRNRPTVTGALGRGLALLPRYLIAMILVGLPTSGLLGIALAVPLLFVVVLAPIFYIYARTSLAVAVLVAEAPIGAIAAIGRSWQLTRGNGWPLAWILAGILLTSSVFGSVLLALGRIGENNPIALGIAAAAAVASESAATVATALVAIAAYRRLASRGT